MKTFLLHLFALSLFAGCLTAQTLRGKIVTGNGEPVPYAAIYIRERAQGIAADDRGEFQTTLPYGVLRGRLFHWFWRCWACRSFCGK